ncbi:MULTISPECIES: DUF3017 domain-containing protein [unclassified Streptomyces]|uniref:DUF3017 domain-containing protein n=1 Tax=unclassified Streptomyces TaxID=2593676 RepID=UPI0036EACDA7
MGAGTSPADPAAEAGRASSAVPSDARVSGTDTADEAASDRITAAEAASDGVTSDGAALDRAEPDRAEPREEAEAGDSGAGEAAAAEGATVRADVDADVAEGSAEGSAEDSGADAGKESGGGSRGEGTPETAAVAGPGGSAPTDAPDGGPRPSRRFPSFTRDTARPEGGGRAASGEAPAPARQWPLLAVLGTAAIGLLIVAADPFAEAFRIGVMVIGAGLIGGAVLRLVVPSVGMLAVRSRFTDLVTYGVLGFLIVMLALLAQPKPWLDVPFLEDAVHFTIR